MNELYLEIAEDMRRERAEKLWRNFGRLAVIVSVAVLIAVAFFEVWRGHSQREAEEKTGQLLKGMDRINIEDFKGAVPIFSALMEGEDSSYVPFAAFRKAQAQYLSGDTQGAEATYATMAARDTIFSDLAKMKSLPAGNIISVSSASPFYYSVKEYNAWQLLGQDKVSEAVELFSALARDEKSPATLKARALEALQHLAPATVSQQPSVQGTAHE